MSEQRDRLGVLFERTPEKWVPVWLIADMRPRILQYPRVISELRQRGMTIINKTKDIDGVRHSWYIYLPEVTRETGKTLVKAGYYPLPNEFKANTAIAQCY